MRKTPSAPEQFKRSNRVKTDIGAIHHQPE